MIKFKNNGSWENPSKAFIKVNGTWRSAQKVFIKNNGVWVSAYSSIPVLSLVFNSHIASISYRIGSTGSYATVYGNTNVEVPQGSTVYCYATPSVGYSTTYTSSNPYSFVILDSGSTFSPTATAEVYTITVYGNGGTASVNIATYTYSTSAQTRVLTYSRQGYELESWSVVGGSATANNSILTINSGSTGNISITANWHSISQIGKLWKQSNITNCNISCICYGNNIWIATGGSESYYSYDGKSWSISNSAPTGKVIFREFFVAIDGNHIYKSTDGLSWSVVYTLSSGTFNQILDCDGIFVAVTGDTTIVKSSNATSWVTVTIPSTSSLSYCGGYWLSVSYDSSHAATNPYIVNYSSNLSTWNSTRLSDSYNESPKGFAYANGIWYILSWTYFGRYSTNLTTWTRLTTTQAISLYNVVYNGKEYVAGGMYYGPEDYYSRIYRSTDGKNWTQVYSKRTDSSASAFTYAEDLWVFNIYDDIHENGSFIYSSDGNTWNTAELQPQTDLYYEFNKIEYANNVFVAGGEQLWYSEL